MSSQVYFTPGSDRMRTNWSSAMESYFIDLMLDQMHKGSRMGHTFNKQAWIDMLSLFNAKFGTKYDTDVLKIHYTNLWKQHNDVRNLLEQNGFSWDDNQKMVVADDNVWDEFGKTHPELQCYRRKSLMNFDDRSLIYAYTIADGRYSRSSHDVDFNDDVQGMVAGSLVPSSTELLKSDWTPAMDQYFIELMMDQLKMGNKGDVAFSKQAWKHMVALFNEKFCSQYSLGLLKHRHKKLSKYYSDIKSLLDRRGFFWDERQQMILADDAVWEKCIKAHPDAHLYRNKTLLNYQDLSVIYGNQDINKYQDLVRHNRNLEDGTIEVGAAEEKNTYFSAQTNGLGPSWTMTMDRYLIDLLQEQILGGNKINHELTTDAWHEMFTLFTARFGSFHDKGFLKNRYRHLRNQYNVINFILKQNGFSWDENREMLTAEDYIWDSITKVHPDASSYRNKPMPSYHKLCVIFGEQSCNGRSSLRAHNVQLDDMDLAFVDGDNVQCHENGDCLQTEWTPSMDRYIIDLMLEQVIRGRKINFDSDDQVWVDVAFLYKEKFELKLNKDYLKSYHKNLGNLFNDMKDLLDLRGFSWDDTEQLITADENVWNAYSKEYPDIVSYRTERTPNYNDLYLIYGDSNSDNELNPCGSANYQNSRSFRTDWTPPMDRFFIDLMVKHVRQGSMVDFRFNEHAWTDMIAKFKAEFGSKYDIETLKSQFMILRKRFNDMNNLLDQKGFAWDEWGQKIITNDDLWNSVVKEYPDARPYCNIALPNYNDLFLIFGDSNNDELIDDSILTMAADDFVPGLDPADDDGLSLFDCGPSPISWTKSMEVYFIELLLAQVLKGNKIGQTFNEHVWTTITAAFNEKFDLLCDKDDVQSWYSSLMGEYNNITCLLNQKGFAWDDVEQRVIADDSYWKSYLKDHPGARKYRNRILSSYNDLCVICGSRAPIRRPRNSVTKVEMDTFTQDLGHRSVFGDKEYKNGAFQSFDPRKKRKSATSSTSLAPWKGKREKTEVPEAVRHEPQVIIKKEEFEPMTIEVLVNALRRTIPDMDDELFLEACQLLEDENKAKVFVTMDVNQRRKWLYRKLNR